MNKDVLVIGGGIAGMQSAMLLAEKDHHVFLVESKPAVGGFFPLLDRTFPTNSCGVCFMSPKPPAYCPIYEIDFHENIDLLTNCELTGFRGTAGDFEATFLEKPRHVNPEKCTLCGMCSSVCPIVVDRALGAGLEKGKAIDLPFPQAIPRSYVIDDNACNKCGKCLPVCSSGAIDLDEKAQARKLRAGAVILGFGFEPFPGELKREYGLGRYSNVVSSIQFERMLSRSGPSGGFPMRPSDGEKPDKIAFIQCVGSRDASCSRPYCSSICCMYATKLAMISKDRRADLNSSIFFMDIRAMGKDYERYYERAKGEYGIKYIRSAVSTLREMQRSKNLNITFIPETGQMAEEEFDLVVLSVGLNSPAGARKSSELLGIELNEHGYCLTDPIHPSETSVKGIYVAGAFSGPKDIPESVTEASSAATDVSILLDDFEQEPWIESTYASAEVDSEDESPKIAVFICDCKKQIDSNIDIGEIELELEKDPDITYIRRVDVTSLTNGSEEVEKGIAEADLNRIVLVGYRGIAVGNLLKKRSKFAGNYPISIVNVGEQCIDVHHADSRDTSVKIGNLITAGIRKVKRSTATKSHRRPTKAGVLVVGGGLAGMTSSLALADQNIDVTLVEKSDRLGGNSLSFYYTLTGADIQTHINELIDKTEAHPKIEVLKQSELSTFEGIWGNYRSLIYSKEGGTEILHGAAIFATGARESQTDEYLHGRNDRVVTQLTLERMIANDDERVLTADSVVMIQCVESRDKNHPYCSKICCTHAVKNALKLKSLNPDCDIYVLYRDIRTYGFYEDHYRRARDKGILFIRYEPDDKPTVTPLESGLELSFSDRLLDQTITVEASLLVLSAGMTPSPSNRTIAEIAGIDINPDGFFAEANPKAAPLDSVKRGIYFCGLCHSPGDLEDVIRQAKAAAARASALLWNGYADFPDYQAHVIEGRCSGCGLCVSVCAYNAREINPANRKALVIEDLCAGCGNCSAACPSGASQQHDFEKAIVMEVMDAVIG